jgi:hypothetical protein
MPNPNPWKARLARAQKQPAGAIDEVQRRAFALLCLAYDDCASEDVEQRRKGLLAFAQLASVYLRVTEQAEILPRLTALEAAVVAETGKR